MPTFEEVARANVPAEVAAGGSNAVEQYVSDWTNWAASGNADSVEHMQNSMVAAQISAGETPAQVYTGTTSPTYGGTDSGGGGGGGGSTPTPTKLPPSAYVPTGTYRGGSHKVGGVELVPGAPGYDAAKALPILQKEIAPYDPSVAEYLKTIPGGYNETASGRNPFFETLTPRADYDYGEFYKVRPLEDGGTAPTPESINEAFEMYFNRPADMPGIQGYMDSGKSIEQIRADLGYQSLYAPELTLAPNAQYYEAPSQDQLGYIQSLGGGAPTSEREDLFSYTAPIFTEQDVNEMYDQLGYPPTAADIEYWTKIYPTSPDVRFSPNPRMQIVNAILAGSDLPQYQYLKEGTDLTTDENFFSYAGTPINPTQLTNQQYSDYRGAAPFGGFFGDDNFNPFDYTGKAPTPLTYQGPVPLGAPAFQDAMTNLSAVQNVDAQIAGEPAGDQGIAAALPT